MKKLPAITLSLMVLTGACTSLQNTNARKNERTDVAVKEKAEVITTAEMQAAYTKTRGGIPPAAFTLAFKGVKYLIDQDKKKYVAEYANSIHYANFYREYSTSNPLDPKGMQFDGFSFIRTVDTKETKKDTALYMEFELDKSNIAEMFSSSRFKLRLKEFRLDYTKAKVPAPQWYMPWTWMYKNEKKMNLDVEITIYATWVNEQTELFDKVPVGKFFMNLRDIPLDKNSTAFEAYRDQVKGMPVEGSSFFIPRSFGHYYDPLQAKFVPCYGKGYYHIDVKVVEAGNKKFVQKVVEDNSPALLQELEKQLKNYPTKKR